MFLNTGLLKTVWCTLGACVIGFAVCIGTAMTADPPGQFCIVSGGWNKLYTDQGITVYAQRTQKSKVLAFRAEGILNAPIDQIMEVLRRVEIADEWMPDADGKYVLKEVSDTEAITYSVNRVPFPFADRELVLLNKLRLDRERQFLVLDIYSVDYPSMPVKKGMVRARMYCGEMRLRPAGKSQTEVALQLYVDPQGAIPGWIVNMFQKRLPYNFLRALEKKAGTTNYELRPVYRQILNELAVVSGQ